MMQAFPSYMLIYLSLIVGGGSLLFFGLFLFAGSLNIVNMGFGVGMALWFDVGLSLLFFIQHSLMIRRSSRQFLLQFFREESFGAVYSIASGIALFAVVILWQALPHPVFIAENAFRWFLRCIFLLCIGGFVWGVRALGNFDALGIRSIMLKLRNRQPSPGKFVVAGPCHYVRHPLYFFSICMIWSCPDITSNRLLFNVLWTVWIILGTILEERDLIMVFGESYRGYQKQVPMLFPKRLCIKASHEGS